MVLPSPPHLLKEILRMKCKSSNSHIKINGAPNYSEMVQAGNQNKFVNNLVSQRNSTFFPHLKPDVKMTEEDERDADIAIHFNGGTPLPMNSATSSFVEFDRSSGDWNVANGRYIRFTIHDSYCLCYIYGNFTPTPTTTSHHLM